MTTVTDRTEAAGDLQRIQSRNRWLVIAIAVLGVAVIFLGFLLWSGTRSTVPAEVNLVIDDYNDALINQDPGAWRATVTDDWYYSSKYYGPSGFLDEASYDPPMNEYLVQIEFGVAWEYERLSDPIVIGDDPWFVTVHQHWSEAPRPGAPVKDYEGTMTYVVIELDDAMKVAAVYWTGTAGFAENN